MQHHPGADGDADEDPGGARALAKVAKATLREERKHTGRNISNFDFAMCLDIRKSFGQHQFLRDLKDLREIDTHRVPYLAPDARGDLYAEIVESCATAFHESSDDLPASMKAGHDEYYALF